MCARNGFRAAIGLMMLIAASLACNATPGSSLTPTVETQGTTVLFIAPENNSTVAEGIQLILAANAGSGISKIEFRVDDNLIGAQTVAAGSDQSSFTARQPWTAKGIQGHFVVATAYRADGTEAGGANITVNVVASTGTQAAAATEPPTVAGVAAIPTTSILPTSTVAATIALPTVFVATVATAPPAQSTQPAQSAPTTAPNLPVLKVTNDFLNIRGGPGTTYDPIGKMNKGDTANVVGRNADRTWWVVEYGQIRGWVINQSNYLTVTGDTFNVPLVAAPPAPAAPAGSPTAPPAAAPTSTTGAVADLIFDSTITLEPANPKAKETFTVVIVIRNAGTVDAGTSLVQGVFQPGNEISPRPVPAIPAGQTTTIRMPVTLQSSGANQTGVITLDANHDINEGQPGEQNNTRTITYTVS